MSAGHSYGDRPTPFLSRPGTALVRRRFALAAWVLWPWRWWDAEVWAAEHGL